MRVVFFSTLWVAAIYSVVVLFMVGDILGGK